MGKAQPGKTLGVFIHLAGDFVPMGLLTLLEQYGEPLASRFSYGLRYLDRHNAAPVDPVSLPIHGADAPEKGTELFPAEGLVLFGGIRDAAPDGWGRRVIESRLQAPLNKPAGIDLPSGSRKRARRGAGCPIVDYRCRQGGARRQHSEPRLSIAGRRADRGRIADPGAS